MRKIITKTDEDLYNISPKKVSVNFQLFFPKYKINSYSNSFSKHNNTKKSIQINSLQKNLFRVKKSTKQITTNSNEKYQKQITNNQKQLKQNNIITAINKLSTQKYIEKIQKFKKFKSNQINKQIKFGLHVLPVEYHGYKNKTLLKDNTQIHSNLQENIVVQLKNYDKMNTQHMNTQNNLEGNNFQCNQNQQKMKKLDQSIDHNENIQIIHQEMILSQQGKTLSINQHKSLNVQQQENIQFNQSQVFDISNTKLIQKQKKCPSQQRLIRKSSIRFAQLQKKKNYFKYKFIQTPINQNNIIKVKLNNMLKNLDQILNAYCCKIKKQIQFPQSNENTSSSILVQGQSQSLEFKSSTFYNNNANVSFNNNKYKKQRYLYFVGSGNNSNLIRSLMKKRFWWTETNKIQQANFIWTQLKIKQILQKQQKISDKKIQQPDSWSFKNRQQQTSIQQLSKIKKNKKNENQILEQQNYLKIFHKNMKYIYHQKIEQKKPQYNDLRELNVPQIVHNHYDANYMLGNKKALFFNLIEYNQYKKFNVYQFIPMTFHIQKIQSRQFKYFLKASKKTKNALWIVKPGENSNRGNGIFVQKSIQKIKAHIEKNANKHSFIVQKYLKNIFLYNRRKFDIRAYMLMVTIAGITKFFWYEQGYLRTSSEIYDPNDISDLYIHLTNDAIQAKNQTYSKYQKGNKISYTQFQRYLDSNYSSEKFSVKDLTQNMKKISQIVVRSTYFKLDKSKKTNGFELFGLDFLVDSHFKPWLLEVNTNPCLQLSSPVLERLIPRMTQNMFRIALDPLFRPLNGNITKNLSYFLYENAFETNKFQLIFDSMFDSDFEWQQICKRQKNVEYNDQDQVFDDNGQQLDLQ